MSIVLTWLALIVGSVVAYWWLRDIQMTWGGFLIYLLLTQFSYAAWRVYKSRRQP